MKVSPAIRAAIVSGIAAGITVAVALAGHTAGTVTVKTASSDVVAPPAEAPIMTSSTWIERDVIEEPTTTTVVTIPEPVKCAPYHCDPAPKSSPASELSTTSTTDLATKEATMPETPARTISCGPSAITEPTLQCLVNPIMEEGAVFESYQPDAFPGFAAKVTFADGTVVTAPAPLNCGSFVVQVPQGVDPTGATVEMTWDGQ